MYFLDAQWDFTLNNYDSVWNSLIQISIVLVSLLFGNLIAKKIKFLRRSLIPSALIGGLILLLVQILLKELLDFELVNKNFMQVLTYHGLGIGFAAMSLKIDENKTKAKTIKSVENGAMTGATYMLQAFCGIAVTVVIYLLTKNSDSTLYYNSGILLPLGFGQGPGNALTWDINFTNQYPEMFAGNGSFGLSIASIGFIVASLVGVLYINIFKKKGEIKVEEAQEVEEEEEEVQAAA